MYEEAVILRTRDGIGTGRNHLILFAEFLRTHYGGSARTCGALCDDMPQISIQVAEHQWKHLKL